MAVWRSKEKNIIANFIIVDAASAKTVYTAKAGKAFGGYGLFFANLAVKILRLRAVNQALTGYDKKPDRTHFTGGLLSGAVTTINELLK